MIISFGGLIKAMVFYLNTASGSNFFTRYKENVLKNIKNNLKDSLALMLTGMVGIFVVMVVLMLLIFLLNKTTKDKNSGDKTD